MRGAGFCVPLLVAAAEQSGRFEEAQHVSEAGDD